MPDYCQPPNLFDAANKSCENEAMKTHDRIREAMTAAGYTQTQVATILKVKPQSVQQWVSGETQRPKKINELASLLGVSVDYLLTGEEELADLPYSLTPRSPVISWEDAKSWPTNRAELQKSEKLGYAGNDIILNGDCYRLQIEDKSMVNYLEAKGFQEGKQIIIDPRRKHKSGDFVIASKQNLPKVFFRQYIKDGDYEYLNPLNIAHYKQIEITQDINVCGVVVAYLDILV